MGAAMLYSTWPDARSAEACAQSLIEARVAACATVLPLGKSFYRWEGQIETAQEAVLLVKTSAEKTVIAREMIVTAHPYDVPCVTGFSIISEFSHPGYLAWLHEQIV